MSRVSSKERTRISRGEVARAGTSRGRVEHLGIIHLIVHVNADSNLSIDSRNSDGIDFKSRADRDDAGRDMDV